MAELRDSSIDGSKPFHARGREVDIIPFASPTRHLISALEKTLTLTIETREKHRFASKCHDRNDKRFNIGDSPK